MKKYALQHRISGATMAATVSGANTNFDRLRYTYRSVPRLVSDARQC